LEIAGHISLQLSEIFISILAGSPAVVFAAKQPETL
jgi:hypothetical protein